MGLRVTSDDRGVKVYRRDKEWSGGTFATYSLSVSSKDKDGNWVNGYIDCQFKKGVEVNNKSVINIKDAFYIVNEYNGKGYPKIMIMDFDVINDGEASVSVNSDGFMNIPDGLAEELPFH